jgi:predicted DNA-binding transcriptional regulator YafY
MKSSLGKDHTQADRTVILVCRLSQGGTFRAREWAAEFGISVRQAWRDLRVVDRHVPLDREMLADLGTQYRRFA